VLRVCKQLVESVTESREFLVIIHKTRLKVANPVFRIGNRLPG